MASQVNKFQNKVLDLPCAPGLLPIDRQEFRVAHVREELDEICAAYDQKDWAEVADGAIDVIYILLGMLLEMGAWPPEMFDRVNEANMQKMRGMTRRGAAYDAVKPEGWEPPDIDAIYKALKLRAAVPPPLLEATRVAMERSAAYNKGTIRREDHFPLGGVSFFTMMWIKMIRVRSDVEAGHAVNRDHLIDLINYASFWLNHIDGRPL